MELGVVVGGTATFSLVLKMVRGDGEVMDIGTG